MQCHAVTTKILLAIAMMCGSSAVAQRSGLKVISDARFGITFAIPAGWTATASSTYQVVARGPQGGFATQVAIRSAADRAVRDYFILRGKRGGVHVVGNWACASSRSWKLNQAVSVVVCGQNMRNGNALVVALTADRAWLKREGGEVFLRSLVHRMKGFRAEDD
jgi:hypothetical protein